MKAEILAVPRIVSANVHASLLPAYRGRSPVFWALRHGEHVQRPDDPLDGRSAWITGDLLYQVRVRTRKNDTVASLYDRIIAKGVKLVPRLIADAERGRLPRKSQPESGGSYFSAAKEADFRLDWSRGSEELRRWISCTPGQCFTDVGGQRVFFLDAKIAANPREAAPGTLLHNWLDRLHDRHGRRRAADRHGRTAFGRIECRCRNYAAKWEWRSAILSPIRSGKKPRRERCR